MGACHWQGLSYLSCLAYLLPPLEVTWSQVVLKIIPAVVTLGLSSPLYLISEAFWSSCSNMQPISWQMCFIKAVISNRNLNVVSLDEIIWWLCWPWNVTYIRVTHWEDFSQNTHCDVTIIWVYYTWLTLIDKDFMLHIYVIFWGRSREPPLFVSGWDL